MQNILNKCNKLRFLHFIKVAFDRGSKANKIMGNQYITLIKCPNHAQTQFGLVTIHNMLKRTQIGIHLLVLNE